MLDDPVAVVAFVDDGEHPFRAGQAEDLGLGHPQELIGLSDRRRAWGAVVGEHEAAVGAEAHADAGAEPATAAALQALAVYKSAVSTAQITQLPLFAGPA